MVDHIILAVQFINHLHIMTVLGTSCLGGDSVRVLSSILSSGSQIEVNSTFHPSEVG